MKEKPSPINIIWFSIILLAILAAAWRGTTGELSAALFDSAKSAVKLAIGLIGAMAFWLGIMKVIEDAGALKSIAKAVRPVMSKLFPEIPSDHPAIGAMVMNISANMLGMGNAATPFGINAMKELDTLNAEKGRATNAMALFLAINTSSVTLLPLGVITIRAAAGASSPAAILLPTLISTIVSTAVAITMAKLLQRGSYDAVLTGVSYEKAENGDDGRPAKIKKSKICLSLIFSLIFIGGAAYRISQTTAEFTFKNIVQSVSDWLIPTIILAALLYGWLRDVKLYESLVTGAKEGFETAVRIIPFMVAIFVAVGMFRASGALDIMVTALDPLTSLVGMPAEALPMALIRPLSGSGAFGIMSEIVERDPDSFLSFLVSTMQGSTETTFYVLAVYFGAVQIKNSRHALPAALSADFAGIVTALVTALVFY
ncbi:spore maturation protein [bacterium]|nr:spore maturation protein [bacterium]